MEAYERCMELHPGKLLHELESNRLVRGVMLFDTVDSTNGAAMRVARSGDAEGLLFLALDQMEGRGRAGRSWFSVPGRSLLFSLLLQPPRESEGLTPLLAIASMRALDRFCEGAGIKWPNDIYIGSRKAAGILAESKGESVVIGMGLNVNEESSDFPPELRACATSLRMETGGNHSRSEILVGIMNQLEECYGVWCGSGLEPFIEELERRMLFVGEQVELESGRERFAGVMRGLTGEGLLRLEIDGCERAFASGDLSLRGRSG